METIEQNGVKVKTKVEECMEEVQAVLDKYQCEIICRPQMMYGQTIYAPMIAEIKK